jgi:hypothetical protein
MPTSVVTPAQLQDASLTEYDVGTLIPVIGLGDQSSKTLGSRPPGHCAASKRANASWISLVRPTLCEVTT